MTTTETAPEPAPPPHRSGFYVSAWLFAILGGLALLAAGFVIGRAVDRRNHHDGPFFRGHEGGGRGLGLLVLLILLALLIAGIVLLVRHFAHRESEAAAAPPAPAAIGAEQVLADRFARGEIGEAEFVSRRNALRS
jgi:putative membrane protein